MAENFGKKAAKKNHGYDISACLEDDFDECDWLSSSDGEDESSALCPPPSSLDSFIFGVGNRKRAVSQDRKIQKKQGKSDLVDLKLPFVVINSASPRMNLFPHVGDDIMIKIIHFLDPMDISNLCCVEKFLDSFLRNDYLYCHIPNNPSRLLPCLRSVPNLRNLSDSRQNLPNGDARKFALETNLFAQTSTNSNVIASIPFCSLRAPVSMSLSKRDHLIFSTTSCDVACMSLSNKKESSMKIPESRTLLASTINEDGSICATVATSEKDFYKHIVSVTNFSTGRPRIAWSKEWDRPKTAVTHESTISRPTFIQINEESSKLLVFRAGQCSIFHIDNGKELWWSSRNILSAFLYHDIVICLKEDSVQLFHVNDDGGGTIVAFVGIPSFLSHKTHHFPSLDIFGGRIGIYSDLGIFLSEVILPSVEKKLLQDDNIVQPLEFKKPYWTLAYGSKDRICHNDHQIFVSFNNVILCFDERDLWKPWAAFQIGRCEFVEGMKCDNTKLFCSTQNSKIYIFRLNKMPQLNNKQENKPPQSTNNRTVLSLFLQGGPPFSSGILQDFDVRGNMLVCAMQHQSATSEGGEIQLLNFGHRRIQKKGNSVSKLQTKSCDEAQSDTIEKEDDEDQIRRRSIERRREAKLRRQRAHHERKKVASKQLTRARFDKHC